MFNNFVLLLFDLVVSCPRISDLFLIRNQDAKKLGPYNISVLRTQCSLILHGIRPDVMGSFVTKGGSDAHERN